MYEGKADMKQHTKTISEVEPEDSKSGEEEKEDDDNAAKKPDKMKYVNVGISETQADFAVNLLQHASHDNKDASVIMSPISVAITLAVLYAGAKADTKAQLGKLIANGALDEEIHKHFRSVVEDLSAEHDKCKLETVYECKVESANRVYAQQGFTVLDKFKADIKRYYGGLFQQVDFKQRAKAAKEINNFVEQKTHQRIKNVITPDVLNELSRLVLVNATYFKGAWRAKFRRESTMKRVFYVSDANEAQVDMMDQTSQFIYFDDEAAQVLGMPYEGEDFFMFVILPRKRYGLQDVLGSLNGKKLAEYLSQRDRCDVNVQLPRFKVETSLALEEALTALGLIDAFIPDKANFEGIAKQPTFIGAVFHKSFIETNEDGTEAAAATMDFLFGYSKSRPPPREFVADHPFLYVITNRSGAVLFCGFILKP